LLPPLTPHPIPSLEIADIGVLVEAIPFPIIFKSGVMKIAFAICKGHHIAGVAV
jgi:hypothetical protein